MVNVQGGAGCKNSLFHFRCLKVRLNSIFLFDREKIFRSSQRVKTVLYFQMNVKDRKAVATICVVLLLLNVQVNSYDHVETVVSGIVRLLHVPDIEMSDTRSPAIKSYHLPRQ